MTLHWTSIDVILVNTRRVDTAQISYKDIKIMIFDDDLIIINEQLK